MARAHSKPLSFFTRPDAPEQWRYSDRVLAVALAEHEAGLHDCGHPRSLALSDHTDGLWKVAEVLCYACAEVDKHHKRGDVDGASVPGKRALVVNLMDHREHVEPWAGTFLGGD